MQSGFYGAGLRTGAPGRDMARETDEALVRESESSRLPNVAGLIGRFAMIPLATFTYSLELLTKTVREVWRTTNHGLDLMTGPDGPSAEPTGELKQEQPAGSAMFREAMKEPDKEHGTTHKENTIMSYEGAASRDRDLQDDMLKLVRYKILFVRRDFEHAFPEREDLVYDSMDGSAFAAWKVAEFIQELQKGEISVPPKWTARNYPDPKYVRNGKLIGLDDEEKKYLRVYYEVLERYVREKFYYEEQQIEILRKIAENMQRSHGDGQTPRPSGGGSAMQIGGTLGSKES